MKKKILKYLIEIVIIVIGVLIAFSLSNWGREIEERKSEREIVSQIYFELSDNLVDLEIDLAIHRNALLSQSKIQNYLDGKSNADSLVMDFYWLTRDEYIFPNKSAFENLKNIGLGTIENESLRDLLTLVYNNNFPRISKGNNFHPDITEYLTPYFKKNFKVNRDSTIKYTLKLNDSLQINYPRFFGTGITQFIGYHPINPKKLQNDEEFNFLISEVLWFRIYKINYYNISIKNVKKILEIIDKEYPRTNTK